MNSLRNILVGGIILVVVFFVGKWVIGAVSWAWDKFWNFIGWLIDTLFSPDAMTLYGRTLALVVIIGVAWLIGRAVRKK